MIGTQTVKCKAVLPQDCVAELQRMAERKAIPSVNHGIRIAVEDFIRSHGDQEFRRGMCEACEDGAFVKRMMDTMKAFEFTDSEMDGEW